MKWGRVVLTFLLLVLWLASLTPKYYYISEFLSDFNFSAVFSETKWNTFKYEMFLEVLLLIAVLYVFKLPKANAFKTALSESYIFFRNIPTHIWLIAIAAVTTRLLLLTQAIRYDEAFTFFEFAQSPPPYSLINYSYPNNHILHSFAVFISNKLLGTAMWTLRLPAFLGGITVIFACIHYLKRYCSGPIVLFSLIAIAFNWWLMHYSVNARGYSWLTAIFIFSLSTIQSNKPNYKTIVVLSFIGFAFSPAYIFPFVVILFLFLRNDVSLKTKATVVGKIALLTGCFYTPAYFYIGHSYLVQNPNLTYYSSFLDLKNIQDLLKIMSETFNVTTYYLINIALLLVLLITLLKNKRTQNIAIGGILSLIATLAFKTEVAPRTFQFIIPLVILGLTQIITAATKSNQYLVAIAMMGFAFLSHYNSNEYEAPLSDLKTVNELILTKNTTKGVFATMPTDYPIKWYLNEQKKVALYKVQTDTILVISSSKFGQNPQLPSKNYHFIDSLQIKNTHIHTAVKINR